MCIVYDKLLKHRQSFSITLYLCSYMTVCRLGINKASNADTECTF